jgi:hypothetical protein
MLDRDVISALNVLIETSGDGENGFAFAAKGLQRSHHDPHVP